MHGFLTTFFSFRYSTHIPISRDSFFNFGIPDDCNCTGFKYFYFLQLQHPYIYIYKWGFLLSFGIPDEPPCYVRQCLPVLRIVLDFFKCLGFQMCFISLYGALSLHNCSSSGSLVFTRLGRIN